MVKMVKMKTLQESGQEFNKRLQELIKVIKEVPSIVFIEKLMIKALVWLEKKLS